MTRNEFFNWLNTEFAKYPMLNRSNPKSVNELVYVLRMSGLDFTINDFDIKTKQFSFTPSVCETFIPTKALAKKIVSIDYEEDPDSALPLISLEVK